MSRLAAARRRGDVPRAPGYVGLWVACGGAAGTALGASLAPWHALAVAAWGLGDGPWSAARAVVLPAGLGAVAGATLGLVAAQVTLGAWSPGLRSRLPPASAPRPKAPIAIVAGTLAGLAALRALPRWGEDPGRLLLATPLVALAAGALALAVPALAERAAARRRWRHRVDPQPAPRRDPDEAPPIPRAEIRQRGAEPDRRAPLSQDRGADQAGRPSSCLSAFTNRK